MPGKFPICDKRLSFISKKDLRQMAGVLLYLLKHEVSEEAGEAERGEKDGRSEEKDRKSEATTVYH